MTPKKAKPVLFRVVKHGITTGEVIAIDLAAPEVKTESGEIALPSFTEMTGKGLSLRSWVRHHTRPASPAEYERLEGIMRRHLGPVTPYPKLTNKFRL